MTSVASTCSDTGLTVTPEQIAEATTLKQLQALLKLVDHSGFEHTTKKQALIALIRHTNEQAAAGNVARSSATAPCTTLPTSPPRRLPSSHVSSPSHTPISFRQAVAGTGKPHLSPAQSDRLNKRTAQIEVLPKKHQPPKPASKHKAHGVRQHNMQQINRQLKKHEDALEDLDRSARSKNLVLYGVPEDSQSAIQTDLDRGVDSVHRLGRYSAKQSKPRPLKLCFSTIQEKHEFLKIAKDLRTSKGIRCDDDLTRLQQQQREDLSADFQTLKSKGYTPFLRGSQLRYRSLKETIGQMVMIGPNDPVK
ncbi:MAG: hypothetical protein Q9169_008653 [Polycauliona sp. 2 TL-2023]